MKTVGKRKYYSLEEAAKFLDETVGDVWERVRKNEVPHENIKGQVHIPAIPLHDFYYDGKKGGTPKKSSPTKPSPTKVENLENKLHAMEAENKGLKTSLEKEKARREKVVENFEARLSELRRDKDSTIADLELELQKLELGKKRLASSLHSEHERRVETENNVEKLRLQVEDNPLSGLGRSVRQIFNPTPDSERIKELEDENEALKVTLRTNEAHWKSELEKKRDERKPEIRYERDRFEAEIENLRRDTQKLTSKVEQERNRTKEAECRARELYSEPERDRTIRPETEQWFNDLKATLNHSEAKRKELDKKLASEREKASRFEADTHLLTQIRNLLGESREIGGNPERTNEAVEVPTPPTPTSEQAEESTVEEGSTIFLKTRFGEAVEFRPPFELSFREVELIELVAGEDEITAEHIRKRTGRKRAVDDLDDLLDRLLEWDLAPIIENSDVYRFDPDFANDL